MYKDFNLKNFNTMRLESVCKLYVRAESVDDVIYAIGLAKEKNLKIFVLGNGSNVVFSRKFLDDTMVIDMKGLNKVGFKDRFTVFTEAGVLSKDFIRFCIRNELSGAEFIAGIPGTIGGMVKMNAGAFGREMKDIVEEVEVVDIESEKIEKVKVKFSYRKAEGLENKIILKAYLKLVKDRASFIKEKIREFILMRKKTQPRGFSAGSVFKNPEGDFAGRIIDELGFKGFKVNDAKVSEKHANFIVNLGRAEPEDVVSLINLVKSEVFKKKGVELQEEVVIV